MSAKYPGAMAPSLFSIPSSAAPLVVAVTNALGGTNSSDAFLVVEDSAPTGLNVHRDGTNLVISWPRPCATPYQLEHNGTLNPAGWSPAAAPVQDTDTLSTATIPLGNANRFYRLRK